MLDGGLSRVLDAAFDAVVSLDADGRIVNRNPRARELLGDGDATELRVTERSRESLARLRAGAQSGELVLLRADGSELAAEVRACATGTAVHLFIRERPAGGPEPDGIVERLERARWTDPTPFAGIVDSLAEAVTIRDVDDRIFYANRAALASLGFESIEALREAQPRTIMDDYIVTGEDGRELSMEDVPSVRLLRGDAAPPVLMHTVHRTSGEERWRLLKTTGLRGVDGRVEAAVTIIEDMTSVKRAELRTRLLGEASAVLASSLEYEETLRNVAWLAVPDFADWCALDLVGEGGEIVGVAVAHHDPAKLELARVLRAADPPRPDPQRGLGRVLATGRAELYREISDAMLVAGARDAEHLELLRAIGMSSAMIVALRVAGRTIGAITLVNAESRRRFDAEALAVAQQIADRAATAVEHARLYRSRSEIAATLQEGLLPEALPAIDGWDVAARYRASGEGMDVGGDFYEAFPVRAGWIVLLGDVTGKGVAAATTTALMRYSARSIADHAPEPSRILARLNETLRRRDGAELMLCSVLCARISGGRVTLSSAGHPLPLAIGDAGSVRAVGEPGPLLGAFAHASWPESTLELADDEALLLYTDGVTDTVGEHGRFGEERLRELAAGWGGLGAEGLLARLDAGLAAFQVGAQTDDTAALALRRVVVPAAAKLAAPLTAG